MKRTFTANRLHSIIKYTEYTKDELSKIAQSEVYEDFFISDIATLLEDIKIDFNKLIYIFDAKRTTLAHDSSFALDLHMFCSTYVRDNDDKYAVIYRKPIPENLEDRKVINRFAFDITSVQMAGFADINCFCQLEASLCFLWIFNKPGQKLYEEIIKRVYKPLKLSEND